MKNGDAMIHQGFVFVWTRDDAWYSPAAEIELHETPDEDAIIWIIKDGENHYRTADEAEEDYNVGFDAGYKDAERRYDAINEEFNKASEMRIHKLEQDRDTLLDLLRETRKGVR